ncbi:hypothetical protein PPERSA_04130 [Pseudocohnilembus persalinus]|uniref:Transmembrane protein n=1 Tax=Pseudocohnilembus persalinus TaxID=266149 RepID=A0A0V0QN96_PSEPJ|nr:hypothetical protein PPERSA_04130 [Pseudocohnilembus persalinus]|eukprot:KRX03578.1 hypothetical protein PPERSA_04130 [Pseudocohnilembus persalinus]
MSENFFKKLFDFKIKIQDQSVFEQKKQKNLQNDIQISQVNQQNVQIQKEVYDEQNFQSKYQGFSAPILKNAWEKWFRFLSIMGIVVGIVLILVYIFSISDFKNECDQNLKAIIFLEIIITLLNALCDIYYWMVKYAYDEKWLKIVKFMFLQWLVIFGLCMYGFILALLMTDENSKYSCKEDEGNNIQNSSSIWLSNLLVSCFCLVVAIIKGIVIFSIFTNIKIFPRKYLVLVKNKFQNQNY